MTLQFSDAVRNARCNAIPTAIGPSPTLKIWTGSPPANCATADSGSLLDTITLPSTWMGAAASGSIGMSGTWTGTASAAGTAGYFRMYDSGGVCHTQGTITAAGGGGDMIASTVTVNNGDTQTVTQYTITDPNS